MKAARLVVLIFAIVAGGIAAYLVSGDSGPPPAPAPVAQFDMVEILVARADINIGQALSPNDIQWQPWPASAASPAYVRKSDRPDAIAELTGAIARLPVSGGEPVRENKLIKAKGSGYMAAILPSGMRAISTEISPETGAGGFILPNDRVDVILSRRDREAERATGVEAHISETILGDVRVLAIDQTVQEKDGQRVVVGKTATLELAPRQAETLALARQLGTLTLALRSIVDADPNRQAADEPEDKAKSGNRVNMVRFGVTTSLIPK
ncbi:MAG: Flp pilus assembly protein CpaB [Deltaproteobacteria bacterium]|nr:Flp pilus assembly protein CpaB [Deltaproteobacteria bacterium]